MTRVRAAAAYKRIDIESAVASADKHELITLLFKAVLSSLKGVEVFKQQENKEQVREYLTKACRILAGLQGSLDYERGGEIAINLGELYGYSIRKLFAANVSPESTVATVEEIHSLIAPIADAWENMDLSEPRKLHTV